jgi:hypothetical protein
MLDRDTSFLARLMNGCPDEDSPNWDLTQLSPAFLPLAMRLLCVRPEERPSIWDDFLAGRLSSDPRTDVALAAQSSVPLAAAEPASAQHSSHAASAASDGRAIEPDRKARLMCAADLEPRAVEWLWHGRVPIGMLTMFAGDPKLGKSYVTLAMAAALSRGLPMPMGALPACEGSTILMSAEDDPNRTIVPRLTAAGADLTKVHILDSVILKNGSEEFPSLKADIESITAVAAELGDCRLIVIDPVSAYLRGVDDNRNTAVRGVLTPLKRLSENLGAAVVLISHLTKAASANGKHRVLGSIGYVGACRANHLFVGDPEDPAGRRVLMLDNGGNQAARAPTLAYVIEEHESGPRVTWSDEPVAIAVEEALRPERPRAIGRERAARSLECDNWLRGCLAEGCKPTTEIFDAASAAGFSSDQIRRAKQRIGAVARKEGFAGEGAWTWKLRSHASHV